MKCLENIGRFTSFWGQNPRSSGHAGLGGKARKWKLSTKKAALSVLSAIQTLANPNPSRNHQKPILIEQEHKDAIAPYKPPSELPYYGRSPPVYPAPIANGTSTPLWTQAYHLATLTLSNLTLPEKLSLTIGHQGPCVGNTAPIPRLSIPSLCIADGPASLRGQEYVSAFPAGIHLSATFDTDLMTLYGRALGREFHNRGVNIALGPVAGPIGRIIKGGRNWEGGGPDPYLSGKLFAEVTRGMQGEGVVAVGKHWVGNEQETRRRWDWDNNKHAVSAEIDDRTLHEVYVWPFMEGLKEGMGGMMCSYQRVNHSYGCQNSKLLNGVLKQELGFEGFVVSDWDGQVSGVGSANAGLDLVMPGRGFWGEKLERAVRNGSVSEERVDDMARRVLASWYLLGQDRGYPERAIWNNLERHWPVDVMEDHGGLIREIGAAGTVVVKNEKKTLPLGKKRRFVCVFGYDAQVKASPWTNRDRYGGGYDENYGWETFNGTLITGGGSGSTTPPYVVSPFEAIQHRVRKEGGVLRWDFWSGNPTPYLNADVCTVFINSYASESFDRKNLTDKFSDDLVLNVASWCSNTIVIIHSTGIRLVETFITHPNVTAVVMAGLPGQESGNSLVDILWGDVNPSGRLPYTIAKSEQDYGAVLDPAGKKDEDFPEDDFSREGVFLDYRAFDKDSINPRFEFGFGLSYTSFSYSSLHTTIQPRVGTNMGEWPDSHKQIVQGGHPELWDVVAVVRCHITNTGKLHGAEVAQLYLGVPNPEKDGKTPLKQLRGFKKVGPLAPGETRQVIFELTRRDLSVWDVVKPQWRMKRGEYKVQIGASSRDLRLESVITLE